MSDPPAAAPRRLRAILLPPTSTRAARASFRPGSGPDPMAVANGLAAHGIDVVIIDPGARPLNPLAGRGSVLESLDPLRALRVLLAERRADIVISVFEGGALPLVLLRMVAFHRVPCVVWDIGLTETWALRERILDQVIPRVDAIFVLSTSQQATIAGRWGRRHGVEVLGHYVDTAFYQPAPPADTGPILLVGEDAGRDFATFLAACSGITAPILIKNAGLPDAGLPPNVTVVRDRLAPAAFRTLYHSCRFVVVPLHQTLNASGVSTILEAGACARACVVSDNAAITDFVIPGATALSVPCGNPEALRSAMTRLLASPATCRTLGEEARRAVEHHWAPSPFVARFAALIRRYARGHVASGSRARAAPS